MNEMKIAPNSSEDRAQMRNPSLSNSKEEQREKAWSSSGNRDAGELWRKSQIEDFFRKMIFLDTRRRAGSEFQKVGP